MSTAIRLMAAGFIWKTPVGRSRCVLRWESHRMLGEEGIITHDRQADAFTGHTLEALEIDSCVRASFAHYNSAFEVDELLKELGKISQE